jgi:hypothetical protein
MVDASIGSVYGLEDRVVVLFDLTTLDAAAEQINLPAMARLFELGGNHE